MSDNVVEFPNFFKVLRCNDCGGIDFLIGFEKPHEVMCADPECEAVVTAVTVSFGEDETIN